MNDSKRAGGLAILGITILALAMVAYYYLARRHGASELDPEKDVRTETASTFDFAGVYSPADGPLEAEGKRIAGFTMTAADGGSMVGSVRLDTIGDEQSLTIPCDRVRFEEKDVFFQCSHGEQGVVSLNGQWAREAASITVTGKVLWVKAGNPVLDVTRQLRLIPLQ